MLNFERKCLWDLKPENEIFKLGWNPSVKVVMIKITNFNISLQNRWERQILNFKHTQIYFVLCGSREFFRGITIEFFLVLYMFILTCLGVHMELELVDFSKLSVQIDMLVLYRSSSDCPCLFGTFLNKIAGIEALENHS